MKIDYLNIRVMEIIEAYSKLREMNGDNGGCGDKISKWSKPMELAIKINVDGCSHFAKMCTGVGCIVRDHHGKWIGGEGCNVSHVGPVAVEVLAILCGKKMAWRSGHRLVVLESDCTEAIDAVMRRSIGSKEDQSIIKECKKLLSRDWFIEILHICREANKIVEWITKWASGQGVGIFELPRPPQELIELLEADE